MFYLFDKFFEFWIFVHRLCLNAGYDLSDEVLLERVRPLVAEAVRQYNNDPNRRRKIAPDYDVGIYRGPFIQVTTRYSFLEPDGKSGLSQGTANPNYGTGPAWLKWFHDARFVGNLLAMLNDLDLFFNATEKESHTDT